VVRLGGDDRSSQRVRIVDAALRCIGARPAEDDRGRHRERSGYLEGHAVSDLPRRKDAVLAGVVETEVARFFSALAVTMGEADDLEDVLVAGMVEAAAACAPTSRSPLLADEPGVVLARLSFAKLDGSCA